MVQLLYSHIELSKTQAESIERCPGESRTVGALNALKGYAGGKSFKLLTLLQTIGIQAEMLY